MKNVKLFVIDDNVRWVEIIEEYFKDNDLIKVTAKAYEGKTAIKMLKDKNNDFDLLLLDLVLPKKGGLLILEKIKEMELKKPIIISTSFSNDNINSMISKYDINYILVKPYELKDLECVIKKVVQNKISDYCNKDIKDSVIKILHELGVPSNIKGYKYIKEGIVQVFYNPDMINKVTKTLYPLIAEKYDTTKNRVEAAIRHAIEVSWNRGKWDVMENLFGNSFDMDKARPTNSGFIVTIAERLRLEYKINL